VSGLVGVACTVTSDGHHRDFDAGSGGSGGNTADGGGAGGGDSSAGTGGSAADDGGSGGADGATPADAAPLTCNPGDRTDTCQACIESACCAEWLDCNDDTCAGDGATDKGEVARFHDCIAAALSDAGTADQDTVLECSTQAAKDNVLLAPNSEALITCILAGADDAGTSCSLDCYDVQIL
jgi:hypothetical protein